MKFPQKDFEELYASAKKRVEDESESPGAEFCDLMNQMTEVFFKNDPPGGQLWAIASTVLPGFGEAITRCFHTFSHLAFEMGRQYEINNRSVDFSSLSIDDFKTD